MRSFKDILAADLDNVFFNANEFGGAVVVDGVPLLGIKDSDRLIDRAEALGNNGDQLHFFRASEWVEKFGGLPVLGQYCLVNNRAMRIADLKEDDGLLEIVFSREV